MEHYLFIFSISNNSLYHCQRDPEDFVPVAAPFSLLIPEEHGLALYVSTMVNVVQLVGHSKGVENYEDDETYA